MRRIFANDALQKQFDENGYVVVDVFSDDEVSAFEKIYSDNQTDNTQGLQLTIKNNDLDVNKKIHDLSSALSKAPFERILIDYQVIYSGFIAKLPHKPNVAGIHRDPTLVDETKFTSLVVWCPLIDTDEKNGALYMIPRSNRIFEGYKCFDYGMYDFKPDEAVLQQLGTLLKVKRGQTVIYDTAMLHFSFQNQTDQIRLVHSSIVVPAEAQTLVYHHNKKRNTIDVCAVDSDFLLAYYQRHIQQDDLDYPLISRSAYLPPINVTADEFRKAYDGINPSHSVDILARIFSWFKA